MPKPALRVLVTLCLASAAVVGCASCPAASSPAGSEPSAASEDPPELNDPPPDFAADVDPWPPPYREDLQIVLEASRLRIEGGTRGPEIEPGDLRGVFAREGHIGSYDYIEVILGGREADPDGAYPLVVLLHGRGDRPRVPGIRLDDLPTAVRLFIPRAPDALGDGFTWIATYTQSGDEALIARSLNATADHLAAAISAFMQIRPTVGRPVVVGFSQGGILTWTLASRRPGLFAAAFPMAGYIPPPLWPTERPDGPLPYIHAMHGDADETVPIGYDLRTVEAMRARGYQVDFTVVPGVAHVITPAMSKAARSWVIGTFFPGRYPGAMRAGLEDAADEGPIGGDDLPRPAQADTTQEPATD